MKLCPASGPIINSRSQYARDADNSRPSLLASCNHLGERKEDLLEPACGYPGLRLQLGDGTFAGYFSRAQQNQSITNTSSVHELMNRKHQRPPEAGLIL